MNRNPMFVDLAGLLLGNAVRLGSWNALLPVAAFMLVMDRVQIPAEDSALLDNFGADYEAYRELCRDGWAAIRSCPALRGVDPAASAHAARATRPRSTSDRATVPGITVGAQ